MTRDEERLEAILAEFQATHPDAGRNLRTLIDETPALRTNLLGAIAAGNLEHIREGGTPGAYLPDGSRDRATGAELHPPNTVIVSVPGLTNSGRDPTIANTMRMVLTHESEHALNKQEILETRAALTTTLTEIARGPGPHDYTAAIQANGDARRLREATDQVGGFNAVADHVHRQNPDATPSQLNRLLHDSSPEMAPYFELRGTAPDTRYEPKAGLILDANGHLAPTNDNIEAMAVHFYDQRPGYAQRYNRAALVEALQIEAREQRAGLAADPTGYRPPNVSVDLSALKLEGLRPHLPPGVQDTSAPYIPLERPTPAIAGETAPGVPATPGASPAEASSARLAPPSATGTGADPVHEDRPVTPGTQPQANRNAMLLDSPGHPNHGMFATLLKAVNERDAQLGREPDEISRQLAGGLTEKARERGLETVGAARFSPDGTKVGMTDTADLNAPWAKTAVGEVGQLTDQSLTRSSENVAAINQQQALEQSLKPLAQAQSHQGPETPAPQGPRML